MKEKKETVIVNKEIFQEDLYYKNEALISVTINYPSFESEEFKLCTNYLTKYYYTKLVSYSKFDLYKLYILAKSDYEYARANDFPFRKYEYYLDFVITYNVDCTISLYYDTYTYTGGAHGSTLRRSDTWDLLECRSMSVTDYILDTRYYREFLKEEIINIIEESKARDQFIYFEEYEKLIKETFNEDNFYLVSSNTENGISNGGLVIYFQQYDIAPYVSGIPTFLIPFSNDNIISPSC